MSFAALTKSSFRRSTKSGLMRTRDLLLKLGVACETRLAIRIVNPVLNNECKVVNDPYGEERRALAPFRART
jgi:hypothetical protein